ncbi:MAG: hypothetical protein OCD03_09345 [Hyphomicrobiales bacterium]
MKRTSKIALVAIVDFITSLISFVVAFAIVKNLMLEIPVAEITIIFVLFSAVGVVFIYAADGYKHIFRYVGVDSLTKLIGAILVTAIAIYTVIYISLDYSSKCVDAPQ